MSLAKTLLKVAIGVAVAKGLSGLAKGGFGGAAADTPGTGKPYAKPKGGLEDIVGDLLGGGRSRTAPDESGSGGLLDQLIGGGRTRTTAPERGSGDLLDQITGGGSVPKVDRPASGTVAKGQAAGRGAGRIGDTLTPAERAPRRNAPSGGLEDLLGGQARGGGLGGLLEAILGGGAAGSTLAPQAREAELEAALALKAMIQAVKADGALDDDEKQKLLGQLGEASREEMAFVQAELQRPVDVDVLVRQVPNGMEEQVYRVSLMAINLDNQKEAQYLAALAEALELTHDEVNALHDRLGVPHIFR
jgi:Protein of unknown function (DUF533)